MCLLSCLELFPGVNMPDIHSTRGSYTGQGKGEGRGGDGRCWEASGPLGYDESRAIVVLYCAIIRREVLTGFESARGWGRGENQSTRLVQRRAPGVPNPECFFSCAAMQLGALGTAM